MSFINFVENKQEFLKQLDLLDFVDLKSVNSSAIDLIHEYLHCTALKNQFVLGVKKYPVFISEYEYIPDGVEFSYAGESFLYANRTSNTIIVDEIVFGKMLESLYYMILEWTCYGLSKSYQSRGDSALEEIQKLNKPKLLENVRRYKIYSKTNIQNEANIEINNILNKFVLENTDFVYEKLKKHISTYKKEETLRDECRATIRFNYYLNTELESELESCDFSRVLYTNTEFKERKLLNLFITNKEIFAKEVINEFVNIINEWDKGTFSTDMVFEQFAKYHMCKKLYPSVIDDLNNDYELNKMRKAWEILKDVGKTVTINGEKYTNKMTGKSYCIGGPGKAIFAGDIKEIKFGKKILFTEEEFRKEFYQSHQEANKSCIS
jgi:hypothetical protein